LAEAANNAKAISMLNSKSFLAIDFGAGTLKVAEFEQNDAGGLRLRQFGVKPLGIEGSQESSREAALVKALGEILAEKSFSAKQINVCAPGFHVFSKFVKLPPVDTSKITQIIRYEAQQNVPFPLDEVVWDYQILGTSPTNELEVLLVAVKSEIVEGLVRVAEGSGLHLKLVDVSPAALCNAFRYNYGDLEGCSMLLDIGAKTSNLLFFEKGKVYSRSINIGANSITQDFANESKMKFPQAEAIKIEKGSVSLGGAYEEPEDPQAASIAKIARQVMTRLHIQVNQTIQFFRGQQGGSLPERVFLAGGASIMTYAGQFFAEKLNLPVDYFNPFRNVEIAPTVELEELSKYAHAFGEVVGLGLRDLAHCPVELNLMPKSSIQRQEFTQKKPYLVAAVFAVAAAMFAMVVVQGKIGGIQQEEAENVKMQLAPLTEKDQKLRTAQGDRDKLVAQAKQLIDLADTRYYWIDMMNGLHNVLLQAETVTRSGLMDPKTGTNVDVGIWIETFTPELPNGSPFAAEGEASGGGGGAPAMSRDPYQAMQQRMMIMMQRMNPQMQQMMRNMKMPTAGSGKAPAPGSSSNVISQVRVTCRGVDRSKVSPTANTDLAYALQAAVTNSPVFTGPVTLGDMRSDIDTNTFLFDMTIPLKHPFRL
jgi:type IV pilus assembly protein PilM